MQTLSINQLWGFIQSLSMTASNERWLAERLLESANAKMAAAKNDKSKAWADYQLSPEITKLALKNRKLVSCDLDENLEESLREKYK